MSDKLFFKGRQDVRQNHIKYGYQTHNNHKVGSQKYPLSLVVTSEIRKQEVEILVADAGLFAEITINSSEEAIESIDELSILLNKQDSIKIEKLPGRNEPCICGSGNKYKRCCG